MDQPLVRFCGIFAVAAGILAVILLAIFLQAQTASTAGETLLANAMWRAFFVLVIIAGVAAWLLVLAQETRIAAQNETRRQTTLLYSEIAAHRITDAKLQKAKEVAESANLAKTRFVVGISHELRTPLNAVLGYAQILDADPTIPAHRRQAIRTIRRSGEHLAALIEGLLDISKIEAGRIEIERHEVRLADFLDPIVGMFRFQAHRKGIEFDFSAADNISAIVHTDVTRLRQILINLLSNAVKFTKKGTVTFRVLRRGEVTEFEITDTGIGISQDDVQRIFEPFERVHRFDGSAIPGVGLGLTITKLLTEILGGAITVKSCPGLGSCFLVKLLLPEVSQPKVPATALRRRVTGYAGPRRVIVAADDDATHRALLDETLSPLGFELLTVPDATSCLQLASQCHPDAFILDLSMPEMDGWDLARRLRGTNHASTPILVISAHPDDPLAHLDDRRLHDAFLPKPLDLNALLDVLSDHLGLTWTDGPKTPPAAAMGEVPSSLLGHMEELEWLVGIGHISALRSRLDDLAKTHPGDADFIDLMRKGAEAFRLDEIAETIQAARRGNRANV